MNSLWNNPPYYISAYGIAKKHGFPGTEKQWLASLKGEPGEGLKIVRTFATYNDMIAAYTTTKPDGFVKVGTGTNCLLYYWDAYNEEWYSIRVDGKSAYEYAVEDGYTGTEAEFESDLASLKVYKTQAETAATNAATYAGQASGSASAAAGQAEAAGGYATNARDYKNDAAESKAAAATSANAASGSALTAGQKALAAEGWAVGEQNGEDVGSDSPYYHNNAEYYAGNAHSDSTWAQGYAAAAQGYKYTAEGFAVGKRDDVDVDPDSRFYHNNAKYYAEQAEAAQEAVEDLTVTSTTLSPGSSASVSKQVDPDTGAVNLEFGIPKGDPCISYIIEFNESFLRFMPSEAVGSQITPNYATATVYEVGNGSKSAYTVDEVVIHYTDNDGYEHDSSQIVSGGQSSYTLNNLSMLDIDISYPITARAVKNNAIIARGQVRFVSDGEEGPQGPAGPGAPTGGTAGQYLRKNSSTDYDYNWESPDASPASGSTKLVRSGGVYTELNKKVDKVEGKGLSEENYTSTEKTKLAGIASGATAVTVDNAMSDSSTNPVQNKVINETLKAATEATAAYHLGFYLDANGDLCQVEEEEEED